MIEIICGEKGKGKTKFLLEKVNKAVDSTSGNIVYIDKDSDKRFDISNKIRLVNISEYEIYDSHEMMGFICGIMSQDYDLEEIFLDSFMQIGNLKEEDVEGAIIKLKEISDRLNVNFVVSLSMSSSKLSDFVKNFVVVDI